MVGVCWSELSSIVAIWAHVSAPVSEIRDIWIRAQTAKYAIEFVSIKHWWNQRWSIAINNHKKKMPQIVNKKQSLFLYEAKSLVNLIKYKTAYVLITK